MERSSAVSSAADRSVFIVGAGVAGSVAAFTAVELGYTVTVFEAGPGLPLPEALQSADLNRANEATDWWWDHPYAAGKGVGGGSAVNGMVVQRPPGPDPDGAIEWAWNAFNPKTANPGPLGSALLGGGAEGVPTDLSLLDGQRQTAANWMAMPEERLTVVSVRQITPTEVSEWHEAGQSVLVAAGALRSPALVGADPNLPLDHASAVLGFEVPDQLRLRTRDVPVATAVFRFGDAQLLLLERAGDSADRGALIASAMVEDPTGVVLDAAIGHGHALLNQTGLEGVVMAGESPVAHACCTLAGIDTEVPVVDASTLPALPSVNPMVAVAAHARRQTLNLLG